MTYYVGTMPVGEHLSHHGIKGMKWGQRRYQNPDGSLTAAGRVRYGVSNAYSRARSGVRSAGNRTSSWYKKNKKTIKKVGTAVGVGAAAAGATYLGMRYGKGALKAARRYATKRAFISKARRRMKGYTAYKNRASAARSKRIAAEVNNAFKAGRKANARVGSSYKDAFKKAGSAVSGAVSSAVRGVGYQARRTGAKAKNAARNLGYMAGNVKGNAKRAASKAGTAAKNAAYKAGSKAKTTAARAKNAAKNAKNIPGNAKRVAYNLKNNKAYRYAAAARGINAAGKAAAGAYWYGVSRSYGASKKGAAAIGAARTFGGRRAALATSIAYGTGKKASQAYKATRRRKKKQSRK